jgi:hypothetical protein
MLNGLAPLLIFKFPVPGLTNAVAGIPKIGDFAKTFVGVPIPLYLDEKLTGIIVESETKAIDFQTNSNAASDGSVLVSQNPLSSVTTINMIGKRDSIVLTAILALCEQAFSLAAGFGVKYSVSYFNQSVLVLDGLMHGLNTEVGVDNDIIKISLQLAAGAKSKTEVVVVPSTQAIPIPTGSVVPR